MDRAIRGLDIDAAVGEHGHSLHCMAHGTFSPSQINEPFLDQILSRRHIFCLVLVPINLTIEIMNVISLEKERRTSMSLRDSRVVYERYGIVDSSGIASNDTDGLLPLNKRLHPKKDRRKRRTNVRDVFVVLDSLYKFKHLMLIPHPPKGKKVSK